MAAPPSGATQTTVGKSVSVSGVGLHSGVTATLQIFPEVAGAGRYFVVDGQRIEASARRVADTRLCTVLADEQASAKVMTIEHLMSALEGYDTVAFP